jgi:hypothetical protein
LKAIDLYRLYTEEREGRYVITHEIDGQSRGFVSYKFIEEKGERSVYLVDMFIQKEYRNVRYGINLLKDVEKLTVENDCRMLYTSVDITTNGCAESMKLILHHGFKPYRTNGSMIYFQKELELTDG